MSIRGSVYARAMVVCACVLISCNVVHESDKYEDLQKMRASDQTYFEDSSEVFFVDYPNAFSDKELLGFASYVDGPVEMRVVDAATDSVKLVYRFTEQAAHIFIVAYQPHPTHVVKCVLYVDGRPKCARMYTFERAVLIPQWRTKYSIEEL